MEPETILKSRYPVLELFSSLLLLTLVVRRKKKKHKICLDKSCHVG